MHAARDDRRHRARPDGQRFRAALPYRIHGRRSAGGRRGILPCSFWLADALAVAGRGDDAPPVRALLDIRNDLGLISEEYDPQQKRLARKFSAGVHARGIGVRRVFSQRSDAARLGLAATGSRWRARSPSESPGERVPGCRIAAYSCSRAADSVLTSSIVTVSGPTPPGTGVMWPATWLTLAKSTSPTKLAVDRRWMPTSTTRCAPA